METVRIRAITHRTFVIHFMKENGHHPNTKPMPNSKAKIIKERVRQFARIVVLDAAQLHLVLIPPSPLPLYSILFTLYSLFFTLYFFVELAGNSTFGSEMEEQRYSPNSPLIPLITILLNCKRDPHSKLHACEFGKLGGLVKSNTGERAFC